MLETFLLFTVCLLTLASGTSIPEQNQPNLNSKVRKRSFLANAWASSNSLSPYNAGIAFRPSQYTISRPYLIPVYGTAGGNFIYYPPQPLYMNPGAPIDNPINRPYQGPKYLPPKNTMVADRFGGMFDEEDDDRPIWGATGLVQMPLSNNDDMKETAYRPSIEQMPSTKEKSERPTRPPLATLSTTPPLVHNPSQLPAQLPVQQSVRTTTVRPTFQTTTVPPPPGPSNCVWAIISCCSVGNPNEVSQNCFAQRGCPGPFWGDSPCTGEFAKAAISAAVNYYNQNPNAM